MADFTHVESFVFDLDNTLYPAHCNLFQQIDQRMRLFIEDRLQLPADKARFLQKHYYAQYGTTLAGLMNEHQVTPEDFMDYVHDIDLAPVQENHRLRTVLQKLPGKHYIFTNGSVKHAENVAGKIGILDLFDGIYDICAAGFLPKPHRETYEKFAAHFAINPDRAAMFEDLPQNLEAPHDMGLTTVLVQSDASWLEDEPEEKRPGKPGQCFDHVHHHTDDLTDFLTTVITAA